MAPLPKVFLLLEGTYALETEGLPEGMKKRISGCCSSSTLIIGESVTVFDTGVGCCGQILEKLNVAGVRPADVEYVVLSHLHLDHFLNLHMYPQAKVISEPNVQLTGGDCCEVFDEPVKHPDWEIIPTPGHTPIHQSLLVRGLWRGVGEERRIMLTGDAFREELWRKGYYHTRAAKPGELESARRVLTDVDILVPGHGPVLDQPLIDVMKEVFDAYPSVE